MKNFVFLFVLATSLFVACGQKNSQQHDTTPQMTLEDSLLSVLYENYGDTIRYGESIDGSEVFVFRIGNEREDYIKCEKVGNTFDRLIRTERTESDFLKVSFANVTNTYTDLTSNFKWENFDYKISLYYMFDLTNLKDTTEVFENRELLFKFLKK